MTTPGPKTLTGPVRPNARLRWVKRWDDDIMGFAKAEPVLVLQQQWVSLTTTQTEWVDVPVEGEEPDTPSA